jgi:hypothetical protein
MARATNTQIGACFITTTVLSKLRNSQVRCRKSLADHKSHGNRGIQVTAGNAADRKGHGHDG